MGEMYKTHSFPIEIQYFCISSVPNDTFFPHENVVKVEHRLTLFYLANDVIQNSKRKNYDFVESWGTALQRATTMVR